MVNTPALGVAHPLKIGKTLRSSGPKTRNFLALKFPHIPDGTDTSARGQITRADGKFTVELPTADGESTQVFSGQRKVQMTDSRMSEFVLVFYDGTFWLERIADYGNFLRHDGLSSEPMDVEQPPEDSLSEYPDSWLMNPDDLSGSPITPEEDQFDDRPNGTSNGNASSGPPTRSGFGGKGVPGTVYNSAAGARVNNVERGSRATEKPGRSSVATKKIAMKSMATKALPNMVQASPKEENDASLDDADIVEELVEEVEEDEVEVDGEADGEGDGDADGDGDGDGDKDNGEDQQSKSSSSEESDSESDSDSDSDSPELTDSSSEED